MAAQVDEANSPGGGPRDEDRCVSTFMFGFGLEVPGPHSEIEALTELCIFELVGKLSEGMEFLSCLSAIL